MLEIRDLVKIFGSTRAVDGVSLSVDTGEMFSLLGGSGCGKSTLLRMIAGLEQPTSGQILVDGIDVTHTAPYARPVNLMFQSYALFPHMTVRQNVAFGLRREGLKGGEVDRRVEEALSLVKLEALATRKPHQMSGGQQQRVALARCLAKRPRLLLLDEPLSALDRQLREHMQLELCRIQKAVGITFIIVTHDQEEALALSSRLVVMEGGRIAQVGTPREVYSRPASRYVADFVGRTNLLEQDGHCLSIRPELIELHPTSATLSQPPTFAGRVAEVVFHGATMLLIVESKCGRSLKVHRMMTDGWQPTVGEAVQGYWRAEAAVNVAPGSAL
jgi:putrescine transport system ATP-binding protein